MAHIQGWRGGFGQAQLGTSFYRPCPPAPSLARHCEPLPSAFPHPARPPRAALLRRRPPHAAVPAGARWTQLLLLAGWALGRDGRGGGGWARCMGQGARSLQQGAQQGPRDAAALARPCAPPPGTLLTAPPTQRAWLSARPAPQTRSSSMTRSRADSRWVDGWGERGGPAASEEPLRGRHACCKAVIRGSAGEPSRNVRASSSSCVLSDAPAPISPVRLTRPHMPCARPPALPP